MSMELNLLQYGEYFEVVIIPAVKPLNHSSRPSFTSSLRAPRFGEILSNGTGSHFVSSYSRVSESRKDPLVVRILSQVDEVMRVTDSDNPSNVPVIRLRLINSILLCVHFEGRKSIVL